MSYHLGVDLGTTYTAAAIGRDGRVEAATLGTRSVSVPTVVCLADDRLLVGEPAGRRAVTDPQRVAREFKRRVGDPTPLLLGGSPVSAELCMARVVEWVVAQVSATEGTAPASLALTHPANWGEYKLDLLRQGLRHVGLTVDRFVPEPVAAATAYAAQRPLAPGAVVAVYDLGGGTFDAALVRAGSRPGEGAQIIGRPDGVERLGGIDFDHAVFRHVLAATGLDLDRLDADDPRMATGLAQLREECVEAKEALSDETDASIPVMLPQRHTEVRLTRAEFETMIRPALDETLVALRRAVASAGVAVEDVGAVLLVGGSSRIPLVGQLVAAELGRPIAVDARPKDAICLGAALVAMSAAPATTPAPGGQPADGAAAERLAAEGLATGGRAAGTAAAGGLATGGRAAHASAASSEAASGPGAAGLAAGAAPVAAPGSPAGPPPSPGATPPGGWPAPGAAPTGSATGRTLLFAAVAVVVLLAGILGALLLRGDDSQASGDEPRTATTETGGSSDDRDDRSTRTTAGDDGLGGLDPGALGGLGGADGDSVQLDPLPGDDWSDEARAQFMEDCPPALGSEVESLGVDPESFGTGMDGICGCLYDDVSATSDFAAFNEQWSGEIDPSSPVGQAVTNAMLSCTLAASG